MRAGLARATRILFTDPGRTWARVGLALVVASVLATCTSRQTAVAPARQGDLCAIFAQRPGWREAVEVSAIRWGAPVPVQMAILWRESSFRSHARPPRKYTLGFIPNGRLSSAYGYAQAIDGTWDWYRRETGNSGASRTEFTDAADFVGWYMSRSERQNSIGMQDAYNQYLAYHEGHAGFRRGRYRQKAWLTRTAREVAEQAETYARQYPGCA